MYGLGCLVADYTAVVTKREESKINVVKEGYEPALETLKKSRETGKQEINDFTCFLKKSLLFFYGVLTKIIDCESVNVRSVHKLPRSITEYSIYI